MSASRVRGQRIEKGEEIYGDNVLIVSQDPEDLLADQEDGDGK